MLIHPNNSTTFTIEQLIEQPIMSTIDEWFKLFSSIGIVLTKSDNDLIPYDIMVTYKGGHIYEIHFKIEEQDIPYTIATIIENIVGDSPTTFIDCCSEFREIYVSFNFDYYYYTYIRSGMLKKIKARILEKQK